MATAEQDIQLLNLLLGEEDELTASEVGAFENMRAKVSDGRALTHKQRLWVERTAERMGIVLPARNMVSSGEVPRQQKDVPLPAVLRRLPLKPPGRGTAFRERDE